jgi:hypothetical protein
MVYTDNNWASSKSVFGEYQIEGESSKRWGLLADACIASYIEGSTIIGGKIGIGETEPGKYNFSVNYEGHMIAQSAEVVGKITASGGAITGDLEISGALKHTNGNYTVQLRGVQETKTNSVFHIAEKNGSKTTYPFRINGDGSMSATKGDVGGWSITDSKIYSGNSTTKVCVMQKPSKSSTIVFATGGSSHDDYSTCPFRVTADGKLTATKATIEGKITAKEGTIGGFDIQSNYMSYNKQSWGGTNDAGIYLGVNGIQLGKNFKVDNSGNLTASSGKFTGTVYAGKIKYGETERGYFSGGGISTGTISGNRLKSNTVTTAYTSDGINKSLGYANFSNDVFNGIDMASAVWASTLRVGSTGTQFTEQIISFIDGLGNTRTYTVLAEASG